MFRSHLSSENIHDQYPRSTHPRKLSFFLWMINIIPTARPPHKYCQVFILHRKIYIFWRYTINTNSKHSDTVSSLILLIPLSQYPVHDLFVFTGNGDVQCWRLVYLFCVEISRQNDGILRFIGFFILSQVCWKRSWRGADVVCTTGKPRPVKVVIWANFSLRIGHHRTTWRFEV